MNYETMHSVFSFSTSLPLLLPRVIFVSFPGSQLPMLAKIWYIKIYHLSVLLLSSIALFIFTSYHQTLPFLYFFLSLKYLVLPTHLDYSYQCIFLFCVDLLQQCHQQPLICFFLGQSQSTFMFFSHPITHSKNINK